MEVEKVQMSVVLGSVRIFFVGMELIAEGWFVFGLKALCVIMMIRLLGDSALLRFQGVRDCCHCGSNQLVFSWVVPIIASFCIR